MKLNDAGKVAATSLGEVAQIYDVTEDTVKRWRAQGMPGKNREYILQDISRWIRAEGPWKPHRKADQPSDPLLVGSGDSPGLERYRLAKAEHAEIDLAVRRGTAVEREKIKNVLVMWASAWRRMAAQLVKKYPGIAVFLDKAMKEFESIIGSLDD